MNELQAVPQKVQVAAIVQVVSGLLNTLLMGLTVAVVLGGVTGAVGGLLGTWLAIAGCPAGCLFGFSWMCGFWGLVLLPIGILETICGLAAMLDPDRAGPFLRAAMAAELVSLLFGGVVSFGAGFVVFGLLRDPEVAAFLDRPPAG